MFAEAIKITAKAAALVAATAAIIALFSVIQIPAIDLSPATDVIGLVYSIGVHYVPLFPLIWNLGLVLLTLEAGIITWKVGAIAYKWVLKVGS